MSTVINKLIGKGMRFPFIPSISKGVDTSTSIERINQSLFILFSTQKGSRLLMPEFGSDLFRYRFDPFDNILLSRIRETVYTDIDRWEPRITVEGVEFLDTPEARDNHILYISVDYRIINTDVKGNFVYPYRKDVYDIYENII